MGEPGNLPRAQKGELPGFIGGLTLGSSRQAPRAAENDRYFNKKLNKNMNNLKKIFLIIIIGIPINSNSQEFTPPCEAIKNDVYLHPLINFKDSTLKSIVIYRNLWKNVCNKRDSLKYFDSFQYSQIIHDNFINDAIADKRYQYPEDPNRETAIKYTEEEIKKIWDYLNNDVPKFLPGIHGQIYDYRNIVFKHDYFVKYSHLGTNIDKKYWALKKYVGDLGWFPIWLVQTWDYGGCENYGGFDFVKIFRSIKELRQYKLPDIYAKTLAEYEKKLLLMYTFKMPSEKVNSGVCSCNGFEPIINDLKKIVGYYRTEQDIDKANLFENSLKAVTSGKITVNNDSVKHCSGG